MSETTGWKRKRGINDSLHYKHIDYVETIVKGSWGDYYYYYDSPGGQRERRSFDLLRDAIASVKETHRHAEALNDE